jgi:hypothetical protein
LSGVSASTIRRYWPPGASRPPNSSQARSPVSVGHGGSQPRICSQPAYDHARLEHPTMMGMTSPRPAEPPASLSMTGFESSSTPWSLSGPAAKPPRTWPPSGPARSRPWRAPWRRCRLSAPPQPRPRLRPPQRYHPTQPTQPGQPSAQACCRWCRSEDRPRATKEKPGFWTRRRVFEQVRRGSNISSYFRSL